MNEPRPLRFSPVHTLLTSARPGLVPRARFYVAAVGVIAVAALSCASPTYGASPSPHWMLLDNAAPAAFHPGDGSDFYEIAVFNDGSGAAEKPVTITDTLPPGVTVNAITAFQEAGEINNQHLMEPGCSVSLVLGRETVACTAEGVLPVGRELEINVTIQVPASATGTLENEVAVTGGGAEAETATTPTSVTDPSTPVPFGASLATAITGTSGVDTTAGGHPFAFTTALTFAAESVTPLQKCLYSEAPSCALENAQVKDLETAIPAGLIGNPTSVPACSQQQFEHQGNYNCPAASQVGVAILKFFGTGTETQSAPVYNIEPGSGQPAELGFSVGSGAHIPILFHVRSDGDYGLTADLRNASEFNPVRSATLEIWGEPEDSAHDPMRRSDISPNCGLGSGGCPDNVFPPKPFLRMPTSCPGTPLEATISGDSWQTPLSPLPLLDQAAMPATTECDAVPFGPAMSVTTSTRAPGAPAGYDIALRIPQSEAPHAIESADLRDTEVTLPEGTVLSPSAANGLSACSDEQFGLHSRAKGQCPQASKVGTVRVTTPLLRTPLTGSVYVGAPECAPCSPEDAQAGRMARLFVEVAGSGVVIKQAGRTRIEQSTGRLVTTFENMPQAPVSEIALSLEAGASAPLVNSEACGPAVTTAALTPWSSAVASPISAPAGAVEGCTTPGFAPGFAAGRTTSTRAGQFTHFAVSLSRNDGEQVLGRLSVTTPPGLLGFLKNVEQCPEAQAKVGTCSAASQIGTGSVVVGPGSAPLTIGGAKVYLTGPYEGKPFGLSIVTPAQAGPFTLAGNTGNGTEVVRASVAIDPRTSALTVASDPLPLGLNGVPLDIRKVDIDINREGFMVNPTDCDATRVTGSIASSMGSSESVSYPFQTTDCGIIPFKPKFTVSTQGEASKANGASLHVRVTSGAGQANIAKVKVNLPLQLPSRLSTLQKACVDSVFEANPGSCAAVSVVGQATAVTPLLAHPLTGPAYLVSHAGAAFPDLEIVLQGEGITLILDGNTQIKKGITSSIFRAVPDAPISSFDLVLPEGPHSVLATNLPAMAKHSLCRQTLNMPTVITGQNGAVVRQTTRIAATGCPQHKTKGRNKKH